MGSSRADLVRAIRAGVALTSESRRSIRAVDIRDAILTTESKRQAHPKGIELTSFNIVGTLDLSGCKVGFPIKFVECVFDEQLKIDQAHINSLEIDSCQFTTDDHSICISAKHSTISYDVVVSNTICSSGVTFQNAEVGGQLCIIDSTLGSDWRLPAFMADDLHIASTGLFLRSCIITGCIRAIAAHIEGQLVLTDMLVTGEDDDGEAIVLESLRADWDVVIRDSVVRQGSVNANAVDMRGDLQLLDSDIRGCDGASVSLLLERASVRGHTFLNVRTDGIVSLRNATLGRTMTIFGTSILSTGAPVGPGLLMDGAVVEGDVVLGLSNNIEGGATLSDVEIAGKFLLSRTTFAANGRTICKLDGSRMKVGSDLRIDGDVGGSVDLTSAKIGGNVLISNCHLVCLLPLEERALSLVNASVGGNAVIRRSWIKGELSMSGTEVRGGLIVQETSVQVGEARVAVRLERMTVRHNVRIEDRVLFAGTFLLSGSQIAGQLVLRDAVVEGVDRHGASLLGYEIRVENAAIVNSCYFAGALVLVSSQFLNSLNIRNVTVRRSDHLGRSIDLTSARIGNDLSVRGPCRLGGCFRAERSEILGHFRLSDIDVADFDLQGRAINLTAMRVSGSVLLGPKLRVNGDTYMYAMSVAGNLNCVDVGVHSARLADGVTTAELMLRSAAVGRRLKLSDIPRIEIRLDRAQISFLHVAADVSSSGRVRSAQGLALGDVNSPLRRRKLALRWLADQNAAQPFEELARVLERNGLPHGARFLRVQSARKSTSKLGYFRRAPRLLSWAITGYGNYPLRPAVWLFLFLAAVLAVSSAQGDRFTTPVTPTVREVLVASAGEGRLASSCIDRESVATIGRVPFCAYSAAWEVEPFNAVQYSLSLALPTASPIGSWSPPAIAGTVLQLLRLAIWLMTALTLAGLTGLIKRQN